MSTTQKALIQSLESRTLLSDVESVGPQMTLADMNGDGKADLVAVQRSAAVYGAVLTISLGRGNGVFVRSDSLAIPANTAFALGVGDLDGDGKLDVSVAGDNPMSMAPINGTFVVTALGDGAGKFQRVAPNGPVLNTVFVPHVARARGVTVSDLDGNGFGDVSVLGIARPANATTANATSTLVVNWDPTLATFAPVPPTVVDFNSITFVNELRSADLDADGKADLVATNRTPLPPSPLAVVRPDLVVVRFPEVHTPVVRMGVNPLNMLTPGPTPTVLPVIETFGLTDLNGDQTPELVGRVNNTLRYASYTVASSVFGPARPVVSVNAPPVGLANFHAGDINGDGLADVLAHSRFAPVVALNVTSPGGPVAVRWSRVPGTHLVESIFNEEQLIDRSILS